MGNCIQNLFPVSDMETEPEHRIIREWAREERPRERLMGQGSGALSDAELLAVVLGSGTQTRTAVDLARNLLHASGEGFWGLARFSAGRLQQFRGIGPAKAAAVAAALEIARRFAKPSVPMAPIRESRDAFSLIQPLLAHLDHEEFWVLCLNNANRVLTSFQLSKGGLTGTLVDVRIILRKALEVGAVGIILAHNHPSGNLRPSKADRQITQKISKASATMDIRVLDHLIVSGAEYYSFADEQLI